MLLRNMLNWEAIKDQIEVDINKLDVNSKS